MRLLGVLFLSALALVPSGCRSATPPTAPDALPPDPGSPPPPSGSGTVGRFVGVGHVGRGSVQLAVANGVARLDLSADFEVSAVPGPFVYLNTTNNVNTGSPLRVGALKSNSGAQTYTFQVPRGTSYTFVLIWCDPFNVPVAEAEIPPTP